MTTVKSGRGGAAALYLGYMGAMTSSGLPRTQYPLGTDPGELERLQFQHRLWSDAAHALWMRAGIAPGSRVLDAGAGPGAASFDLAGLVTSRGAVVAVDESESFIQYLKREAEARGLPQIRAVVGDAHQLASHPGVERGSFDLAYARWLLCFTPRADEVVTAMASCLRPGGVLCVHDYFNYHIMTPAPRRASYTRVVDATAKSWRDSGGDPDVVGSLPRLCHAAGLEIEHLACHQRVARPGDPMWWWASTWWRSYGPKLVDKGYIRQQELDEFEADLAAMTRESDFLVLPPVFEVMARKR